MTSPAASRGARKALRDAFQAVVAVVAAGGASLVIDLVVGHVDPVVGVVLAFVFKIMVAYAQNYLETAGKVPAMLPSPGLVTTTAGGLSGKVVATVDTVVETTEGAAAVVGDVIDTAGKAVGAVTGIVENVELLGGQH